MSIISLSRRLSSFLMVIAAAWAFVLTFFIVADIVGRNVFDSPVYGVREIVMNSIVMIVFLQAGYAIHSRSMLRADFLIQTLPVWLQRFAATAGHLLGALFFLMIVVGGWDMAEHAWIANEYEGEGALRVPTWPTRFTIIFGSAVACLNYFLMIYLDICQPEELEAPSDSGALSHD